MSDPKHPTNPQWVMFDPLQKTPPKGENLLVLTCGGVLVPGPWHEGALAWCYKPVIPNSVKERMNASQQKPEKEVQPYADFAKASYR